MTTSIRIKVECYNTQTGAVIANTTIEDSEIVKPVDTVDLGYKHVEQLKILKLLQDFKLTHQTPLINDGDKCPECGKKSRKFGIRQSQLNAALTDHQVGIQ